MTDQAADPKDTLAHTEFNWIKHTNSNWSVYLEDDENKIRLSIFVTGVSSLTGVASQWKWEIVTEDDHIVSDSSYAVNWHAAVAAEREYKKYMRSPNVLLAKVLEKLDEVLRELRRQTDREEGK